MIRRLTGSPAPRLPDTALAGAGEPTKEPEQQQSRRRWCAAGSCRSNDLLAAAGGDPGGAHPRQQVDVGLNASTAPLGSSLSRWCRAASVCWRSLALLVILANASMLGQSLGGSRGAGRAAASDLMVGLALGASPLGVGADRRVIAQAGQDDQVQGLVEWIGRCRLGRQARCWSWPTTTTRLPLLTTNPRLVRTT